MTTRIYKATKTRSNRPGWSVTFNHPRRSDARGKFGLKVRRGLGTTDDTEADRLVEQINILLADESWWNLDRQADAARRFNSIVVAAFFDGIEVGKAKSKDRREAIIPLPTPQDGYARVMLAGTTGAGKTTLLRQLIGSDHKNDRFPSTSTAKTTTADIEIILAPSSFQAVVTFMTEHEVRCAVDECLEDACFSVIRGAEDGVIAGELLEHREQRFRLSYILGAWQQKHPNQGTVQNMDFMFTDETTEVEALSDDEIVGNDEVADNNKRLVEYVGRIRTVAAEVRKEISARRGDFSDMGNANQRSEWREDFTDVLYNNQGFGRLSLDIMDAIVERFALFEEGGAGDFEREATGWPTLWYHEENDRDAFLKQARWFSGNHDQQFGRLLTPLVDGLRVSGPFQPAALELQDDDRKLVLLDGEGLGHSAKEASTPSTKVTERFPEADMILLVDNAQSPMQAASLEFLRSVGNSGHSHKVAVAFTHFDQVQGDNLSTPEQRINHVQASTWNAIASLRESSMAESVAEMLEEQLADNAFYLGGLNRATASIPPGFISQMRNLLKRMQQSAEPAATIEVAPIYNIARLELALRDASDGFKNPWRGRLGLSYYKGVRKEHWGRVKALCRRVANRWDNEYNGLRPAADLISQLQDSISLWLESPAGWTRNPDDESEGRTAINAIRDQVFRNIHILAERRLIVAQLGGWQTAFGFSGGGSSLHRAERMARIYDEAAPSVSSVPDARAQQFLDEVIQIVCDAVMYAGGSVEGVAKREPASIR